MTISFDTIETEALKLSPVLPTRYERNNRLAAANRAEEIRSAFGVAKWNAVPLKTDQTLVRSARV